MYVKLYQRILDSSIAADRRLRHFFTDLLLCADQDGNVLATEAAIARKINASEDEVRWGLGELMKPDPESLTAAHGGRRVIKLDGCGHGWKIVNYEMYRDFKNSAESRASIRERVKRYREKSKDGGGRVTFEERVATDTVTKD